MKDAHKEEGTEDQAEKSHDSRNHCHEWLKIIALLSNGFNIGLNVGIHGPTLPDLALLTGSTLPEMSMVFVFTGLATMISAFASGLIFGRFEGFLVISLISMLQAACTAVVPWCTNLTLLTTVISLAIFFTTLNTAGTTYLCLHMERSYLWTIVQVFILLINVGKSVVPFVVAPFLAHDEKITPIPGSSRSWFYPHRSLHWPQGWTTVFSPNISSHLDALISFRDVDRSPGSTTKVGYSYVILSAFSVLIGIFYSVVALKNGCHLWERPDTKENPDIHESTTVSDSIGKKTVVLTFFFIMCFLLSGIEAVDSKLLMSFLSEYLNRSKEMGVLASSVYQGVKVLACIVTALVVNKPHPSLILLVEILFMLTATSLMTVSVYLNVGDVLLWITLVLLATGIANFSATIPSWLRTRYSITGMIIGIATFGFGLSGMVLPTLTSYLLDQNGPIMFPLVIFASSFVSFIVYFIIKLVMKEQCFPQMITANDTATSAKVNGEKIPLLDF